MGYRDDREALRARAEMLESDLEERERELDGLREELRRQEEKDEGDEQEIARLRAQLAELQQTTDLAVTAAAAERSRRARPVSDGGAGGRAWLAYLPFAGLVIFIVFRLWVGLHDDKVDSDMARATHRGLGPSAVASPAATAETPATIDVASFGAVVVSDTGFGVPPGAGCLLEAAIAAGPSVQSMRLSCGEVLYERDAKSSGGVTAVADSVMRGGSPVYSITWFDEAGTAPGTLHFDLDPRRSTATLTRDDATLVLAVDDWSSAPPLDAPDSGDEFDPQGPSFRLHARRTSSDGPGPEVPSAGCELVARPKPAAGHLNCRIRLRCGENFLYGAGNSGFNECAFEDGLVVAANDEGLTRDDTDPIMLLRRDEGYVKLEDSTPRGRWHLRFALEQDPRCALDGVWQGELITPDGERSALHLDADGLEHEPLGGATEGPLRATVRTPVPPPRDSNLDCVRATFRLRSEDGALWRASFGPGFATLVGSVTEPASPAASDDSQRLRRFWLRRAD